MAAPIDLSSTIRAVTVYRRGALVTRTVEIAREGEGFPARIQVVGLPLTLDDSSMRVEVEARGPGAGPIAGDLQVSVAVPGEDPTLPPPTNAELDAAELELALAIEQRDRLQQARAAIEELQPGTRGVPEDGKPPMPSPTTARLELLAFRRQRSERLAGELRAAVERVRLAKERVETLRERERVASAQRNVRTFELRKAAILELEPPEGSPAESVALHLRYFVPGARWAPAYVVRLDRTMREAKLELRAMVGQSTGEDWSNVHLTLSTASPQQWTELPELKSIKIGRRQPPPAKTGWRPPPVGAAELYADFDRDVGVPATPSAPPVPRRPVAPSSRTLAGGVDPRWDLEDQLAEQGSASAEDAPVPPPAVRARRAPAPASGAPPPAAAAAPAPMAPPQSMPMPETMLRTMAPARKSGGVFGAIGGAIEGAVGGVAAAFGGGDEGGYGSSVHALAEDDPELELLAGRDLLEYGRLRMFPASDGARRGSLRRIEARMLYQQVSVTSFEVDAVFTRIGDANRKARQLEQGEPPPGHHWPASEAGFDYAYVADAPIDLASDGSFHSLAVDLRSAEASPRYVTVPRETQDVFRIVELENPLQAPLLPGPADVYVAGKFALTSELELTPIGGRIELGLGVEQAIKIARNVSYGEDSSGMFKRQLALSHEIVIEVINHLRNPATVEVRERLPIPATSEEDDIEVEVDEVSPRWHDYEPEPEPGSKLEGGKVWKVEVPAGGEQELRARWTIRLPTNHELVGGNRRES